MDGFHFGDINSSRRLRLCLEILKDATRPLTVMEIQDESRSRGSYLANPATAIGEIGRNSGYRVSDGLDYGQKKGPAVLFPDKKYRYWIISAPGWHQSWRVTKEFKIVSWGSVDSKPSAVSSEQVTAHGSSLTDKTCSYSNCNAPVPPDRAAAGYMTCCDEHGRLWREEQKPAAIKFEADQVKMF